MSNNKDKNKILTKLEYMKIVLTMNLWKLRERWDSISCSYFTSR